MAQQSNALQIVSLDSQEMVALSGPETRKYLDSRLVGAKFTAVDLLMDLAAQMVANPKLKACTPQSLYGCLIFAARHQRTFGPGGVWIVPRGLKGPGDGDIKVQTAQPQLDYRAMESIAQERFGLIPPVTINFVYPGEKATLVTERGVVVDVRHEIDPARNRTLVEFTWGYLVAKFSDGRHFIYYMDRASMEKRRQTSAARDGDAWKNWPIEMYSKTLERKAMTVLVRDFTASVGDGEAADTGFDPGEPRDITAEVNAASKSQTARLKEQLAGPTRIEQAKAIIDSQANLEALQASWTDGAIKNILHGATKDDVKAIEALKNARKQALLPPQPPPDAEVNQDQDMEPERQETTANDESEGSAASKVPFTVEPGPATVSPNAEMDLIHKRMNEAAERGGGDLDAYWMSQKEGIRALLGDEGYKAAFAYYNKLVTALAKSARGKR